MSEDKGKDRCYEMSQRFGKLMSEVRDEIRDADPRSFDLCLARMEEGLMWANKGILARANQQKEDSNEQ